MKELKVRAWDKSCKEMYWRDGKFDGELLEEIAEGDHEDMILLQYTGLKDKNGVEIYEGDIVKTQVWTQIGEGISSGDWYVGEIMYSKGSFYGHFQKPEVMEYLQFFRYEVIGNIYENNELLEIK